MKHYFKKITKSDQGDYISFGEFEEKDITELGKILCKDIFTISYDRFTEEFSWDTHADFFEQDEIESISEEEYNIASLKFELVKVLEKEIFKTLK